MPRFDRTGPMGSGPRTGRGMGPCGEGYGMRAGYGMGRGFGYRNFYTKKEELEMLKQEAENLENELKAIKEQLAEVKD